MVVIQVEVFNVALPRSQKLQRASPEFRVIIGAQHERWFTMASRRTKTRMLIVFVMLFVFVAVDFCFGYQPSHSIPRGLLSLLRNLGFHHLGVLATLVSGSDRGR